MGLILSGNTGENKQGRFEGANYSTIEYLLSGLPVISTPNQGGRNYWLNSENSVQCEPNIDAVYDAYLEVIDKLESGYFNPKKIRAGVISEIIKMRENLNKEVSLILVENGVKNEYNDLFSRAYWHKFVDYSKSPSDGVSFLNL